MSQTETLRIEKRHDLSDPFIVAGSRAYLIGAQHGGFPAIGFHRPGEMGGVWAHPIKLIDGFWLRIDGEWLGEAAGFISEAFAGTQEYVLADGLSIERRQFVPDDEPAVVVQYMFRSSVSRRLAVQLVVRTDLQMAWPDRSEAPDEAQYSTELDAWIFRDRDHSWYAIVGASTLQPLSWAKAGSVESPEPEGGDGVSVALDFILDVSPDHISRLELVIAGSCVGLADASKTFQRVRGEVEVLWHRKGTRYAGLLARSSLSVPDPSIERAWDWLKCNYDWLVRDVPGMGRGLGGGVEEYPWWFGCDAAYALLGAIALGQHDMAIATIDLLRTASVRANGDTGRVIHECSTNGEVTGAGSTAETPQLLTTIWQTFCWSGDMEFLRRCYDFCRRGLLDWTLGECTRDGDLLPYGWGITERDGLDLQCIDTAVHTVRALSALADMANALGDDAVAARCRRLATTARLRINEAFWMEDEGMYGDMLATSREMESRLQRWLSASEDDGIYYGSTRRDAMTADLTQLLRQAKTDPEPDRKRPWLLRYWIVLCPLEAQLAPRERAFQALARLETPEFSGPEGMYISGLDRIHAMSISTGALAVAEAVYGRVDEALSYVRTLTDTLEAHMPGAISEISPCSGCFVQAWSAYGVVWPIVAHIFGLQPEAHRRRLNLSPSFPAAWPEAHLTNVRIGDAIFDFHWNGTRLQVIASEAGWTATSSTVPVEMQTR